MEGIDDFIGEDVPQLQTKEERKIAEKKYRKSSVKIYLQRYFANKKSKSKSNNIEWNLDFEWFMKKYKKGCALTNMPFHTNLNNKSKGSYSPYQVSIDRIDPKKGYMKSNSRLILYSLNMFKSKWSDEIVYEIAHNLVRNRS